MARKRRAPSPPPPPQEESSSEESSSGEEEEEAEGTPATQKPPQNPKPPSTAAANDADSGSSDGDDEESSDSEIDAEAFQLRQVACSPSKPPAAASKLESDADDEEEEEESVQKKAAKKPLSEAGKKRLAPEPTPSGKAKRAKAEIEKVAPEASPSGKAKKAKAGTEKAAPDLTPDGKGKKPRAELEKAALGPSPSSKSEKPSQVKRWTTEDEIKILEAIVGHVKTKGTQPSAGDLIAAVGDSLDRKNCSKSEIYEKVRTLKQRFEITAKKVASTGALPGKDDDLRKYKLSEAAWGEDAKEVSSASMTQTDGVSSKSKKGQTNKEKMDDHSKGGSAKEATNTANENVGTLIGSKKGQATKEKIDEDTKSMSSKRSTTSDTPVKSKKRGDHKEGLQEAAKTDTSKEIPTTDTQNGGTLVRSKRGESDKEKIDGDALSLRPNEATQNGITQSKNGETHKEGMDIDANVQGICKGFDQLQNLYPNLTSYVESIKAQHPCGETLKRAFEFIDDEKACTLESKIKKQRVAEVKTEIRRADTKKEVANILIGLLD